MNAMSEKSAPYWWEDAPREQSVEIAIPDAMDVAVVGAGYSGLCAALELARGGASVVVFEAGVLGYGASTRNGGMLGPSFHKLGIEGLKSKYGVERTNTILRESLGFVDYLRDFLETEGIDADFVQNGRFRGALRAHHYDAMARQLDDLQAAAGVKGAMIPKADQHNETGSPIFHGGVVYDYDAGLHPAKYHDGLVRRAREAGVVIIAQTAVTGLVKTATGFDVVTARGTTRAAQVAVCSNGYTDKVTKDLRRRVIPLRSAMIATEPLESGLIKQLMPNNRVYGDSRRLVAYYRPSPDGKRILFGARGSGLDDNPVANLRSLRFSLSEIYPQLSGVPISHVWSGLVAYTFDHVPHVGQFGGGQQGGVFYAMGYCGSGVARASYFGNKLGRKMLGVDNCETAFDDLVFETRPFYTGNPWFMPAVLAWHRIADRFGL